MTQYTPQHGQSEPQQTAYAQPGYPAPPFPPAGGYPPAYGAPPPVGTAAALAPGVGGVIGFTLLFGLFGAISASNRANKAKALGLPTGKYWGAFFGTLAVSAAAAVGVVVLMIAAFASLGGGTVTSSSLEQSIITNGDFKDAGGASATVTGATCTAKSADSTGAGTYTCLVDFSDKSRTSYNVTVDADGTWVTDNGK